MAVVAVSCSDREKPIRGFLLEEFPPIPPVEGKLVQPGLAGPVAGVCGDYLLVAGGANFEEEMPWRGGAKSYHDEIFLFRLEGDGDFVWTQAAESLPFPMAYPACLSFDRGVLCIGGENAEGPVSDVFLFLADSGKVTITRFPSLPMAITSPGAALIGKKVYVAGGLDSAGAVDHFLVLQLDEEATRWQSLPPLPVAMSHSVVVARSDGSETCIYVLGGRNKTTEVHTFFSDIWKFKPSSATWTREGEIAPDGKPLALSAGTGIAAGKNQIVLFGGDPGIWFNRTEKLNNAITVAEDSLKQRLLQEKDTLLSNHPGFTRDVLVFNTVNKNWIKIGEAEEGFPATTTAFFWNDLVIIPSGEIRPGVRTPQITALKFQE